MTAIEALIATTIFAVVIAMSFGIMHWTTLTFSEQIREATLADRGERLLKVMVDEMGDGTNVSNPALNVAQGPYTFPLAEIHFKVPIRFVSAANPKGYDVTINTVQVAFDANGNPLNAPTFPDDKNFRLKFGWRDDAFYVPNLDQPLDGGEYKQVPVQGPGLRPDPSVLPAGVTLTGGATADGFICFRYVMNTNARVGKYGQGGLFREAQEGVDIDGDGQKTSTYAMGFVERSYWVGAAGAEVLVQSSRRPLGDTVVLQPIVQTACATPDDAQKVKTSRIFWDVSASTPQNMSAVQVCVWILSVGTEGQPHLMKCVTSVFLRNQAGYVTATSATGTN
jgi:hypothetical protein